MPRLAPETVAKHAAQAGFKGSDITIATAIAGAESGYNTHAHNPNPPDNSYGLMQINMIGRLGPERRAAYNLSSNEQLFDPATNMRVAYAIKSARGSWSDWSTYNNGSYKKFIRPNIGGVSGADLGGPNPDAPVNDLSIISSAFTQFSETFRKSALTAGAMALGIVLIVLGIVVLLRKQVAGFLPTGKVGKIARKLT